MGYAEGGRKRAAKPAPGTTVVAPGEDQHRRDLVMRLRRVEGQIRGVMAMIETEVPCDAVAQQLAAARKALDRAFYEMMACDFEREIIRSSDSAQLAKRLAEKTRLLAKYS